MSQLLLSQGWGASFASFFLFFLRAVLKHVFVSDAVFFHYRNTFKSVSLNIKTSSENNNGLKTIRQQTGVKQISSSSCSFMPLTACHNFSLGKRLKNVEILVNFSQNSKTRAHLMWVLSLLSMPSGYHHQKYHHQSHELPDTQQAGPKFKWQPAKFPHNNYFFPTICELKNKKVEWFHICVRASCTETWMNIKALRHILWGINISGSSFWNQ